MKLNKIKLYLNHDLVLVKLMIKYGFLSVKLRFFDIKNGFLSLKNMHKLYDSMQNTNLAVNQ